jgi:hypothetical protein
MIFVGMPCPACGLSRAGILLFRGRFAESFAMHPLFIPTFILILCLMAYTLFWPGKINQLKAPAMVLILISFAVYAFRMVDLFPNQPPMVINNDSILHNILYRLKELT